MHLLIADIDNGLNWNQLGSLGSLFSGVAALVALLFVAYQLLEQKRIARAEFVNHLAADIERNIELESKLDLRGELYESKESLGSLKVEAIERYLNFFERVYYIVTSGAVDLATIDGLFAYRFFHMAHNPNVQAYILLLENRAYFRPLFRLHRRWLRFRIRNKLDVPRLNRANVLSKKNEDYNK